MALPKRNSLWSRKDSRRPAVVKVTKVTNFEVFWKDVDKDRDGFVWADNWHKRYRPFTAPAEGTATTGGEK